MQNAYASAVNQLEIRAHRVWVHLGWSEEERAVAQEVEFYVRIRFAKEPAATQTDDLADTLCYASLCEIIDLTSSAQPFRLIEALTRQIYSALRRAMDLKEVESFLQVTTHKLQTPIENLRGGVSFTFGDGEAGLLTQSRL